MSIDYKHYMRQLQLAEQRQRAEEANLNMLWMPPLWLLSNWPVTSSLSVGQRRARLINNMRQKLLK